MFGRNLQRGPKQKSINLFSLTVHYVMKNGPTYFTSVSKILLCENSTESSEQQFPVVSFNLLQIIVLSFLFTHKINEILFLFFFP